MISPTPPVSNVGSNSQDDEVIHSQPPRPQLPALTTDHNNVTMLPPRGPPLPWPAHTVHTLHIYELILFRYPVI